MSNDVQAVSIESIRVDERTQQRPLNGDNITRLAGLLEDGHDFSEPIEVFRDDDGTLYLAHGHHRYHAYNQAGYTTVEARIYEGDLEAAIDHSCKPLNAEHGLPETAEDRRKRIDKMIERHPKWSNPQLAAWCGVSHETVRNYRKRAEDSGSKHLEPEKRTGRDGKKYPASKKATKKKTSKKAKTGGSSGSGNGQASSGGNGAGASDGHETASEGDGEPQPSEVKDGAGDPVAYPDLVPVFEAAKRWRQRTAEITAIKNELFKEVDEPHAAELTQGSLQTHLDGAANTIKAATPYAPHRDCRGEGCEECEGRGWVTQTEYKQMTRQATEMRG